MAVRWSSSLINTLAPGLASFSTAEIPDLTSDVAQAEDWVANFFLNSILGQGFAAALS